MDILEAKKIWTNVKNELRTLLPEHVFSTWLDGTEAAGCDDGRFNLITAHAMAPMILKQQYSGKIREAFKAVTGEEYLFSIVHDEDFAKAYEKQRKKESVKAKKYGSPEDEQQTLAKENLAQMQSFANLNLKYKFENFVVGENSEFTFALAQNVAKNPAKKYNPLFIYGAPGLGKTHIMQAIGHHIIFNKPKLKVRYIKTEEYVNELIKSIQKGSETNKRMEAFRQKYRNVDVLLIDDIQFIESKKRTMDEIFHTFDSLLNKNKQIVITSDRIPADIPTLPTRLKSRFEMGIMTEITPPDFETRVAILQNLAEQEGMNADFSVFEYIATNFENNVRELEGAYNKVSAYSIFSKSPMTLELAKKVLKCEEMQKNITLDKIATETALYYGVTLKDFQSSSRAQKISGARQVAVYLSRELTGENFEDIADFFNKKHPTMLYSYDKIKNELINNTKLQNDIKEITKKIRG